VADAPLGKVVDDLIAKMRGPLGLQPWTIRPLFGPDPDGNKAACAAMWEYLDASISVDPDALDTGDELDEIIAHELGHCHLAPIATFADDCMLALCDTLPEPQRASMFGLLRKQLDKAEEFSMTQIGQAYVRLFRARWAAEADLAAARAEIKQMRKAARDGATS
jgi:hypothetical protein